MLESIRPSNPLRGRSFETLQALSLGHEACDRRITLSGLGGLDILVSDAGRQQAHASILDISTEHFDWTMKTNIYALFLIIKAPLPHMPKGACIHRDDVGAGLRSHAGPLRLCADQGCDDELHKVAGEAARARGHSVYRVAPGPIWTPLQVSGGASQEKLKQFGGQTPLGRPGQPGELGGIYVQLADNTFANGQVYGAAGGSGQP